MQDVQSLSVLNVLFFVLSGGVVGGCLSGLAALDSKEARQNIYPSSVWSFLLVKALIGAGGAVALVMVLIFANKFKTDSTVENILWLFSLSLVAGFVGYRLLPGIAKRLEDQIEAIEKKTEEVEKKTEAVEKKALKTQKEISAYTQAITRAAQALATGLPGDWQAAIDALVPLREQNPADRMVNIYLGRLYRRCKRFSEGIDVLSRFIEAKKKLNQGEDEETAVAYYNRACYQLLKMKEVDPNEAKALKESGYRDLELALNLDDALFGYQPIC